MAEGAAAKKKCITQDQTSYQASANVKKVKKRLFVEDPIKEYKKDMALIGHKPTFTIDYVKYLNHFYCVFCNLYNDGIL